MTEMYQMYHMRLLANDLVLLHSPGGALIDVFKCNFLSEYPALIRSMMQNNHRNED